MKQKLLELLVCPSCKVHLVNLKIEGQEGQEVTAGSVSCPKCKKAYKVSDGVPDFRPKALLSNPKQKAKDKRVYVKKANILYHNAIAGYYENDASTYDLFTPHTKSRTSEIFRKIKNTTEAKLHLDIGCGTGNLLILARGHFNLSIGLDISPAMLSVAYSRNFGVICGDMENIPLPNKSVDVVTCSSAIHHLYGTEKLFREIFRILKKGGVFYSDHDHNKSSVLLQKTWLYSFGMKTYKRLFLKNSAKNIGMEKLQDMAEYNNKIENGLDPKVLKSQLENIGFSDVKIFYHSNCPSLKKNSFWHIPFANKIEMMVKFLVSGKMSYSYLADYFIILAKK